MGAGLLMESKIPLGGSILSPGCCPPSCSTPPPQSSSSQLTTLDEVREKWGSLAASCTAGEAGGSLTHLTFSGGKNHGLRRALLYWAVLPWGRGDVGKGKLFLLPSSRGPVLEFFAPTVCRNFPPRFLDFHKGSLVWW